MNNVIVMDDSFDALLDDVLRECVHAVPTRLEQRLTARLLQESVAPRLALMTPRSATTRTTWVALIAHAAVLVVLIAVNARHTMGVVAVKVAELTPNKVELRMQPAHGGGGAGDSGPAAAGHAPQVSERPLLRPMLPPPEPAKLQIEPQIQIDPSIKMAESALPNIGLPSSQTRGVTLGRGLGNGLGDGNRDGVGVGSVGNTGGGYYKAGTLGLVAPAAIYEFEPEYSDEARRAKLDGDVIVRTIVDEHGVPTEVHVVRRIGYGLDEKAEEAVRQFRFRPARKDGRPVKAEVFVNVSFRIF